MVKRNDTSGYKRKTARVLALETSKKVKEQQFQKASGIAPTRRIPHKGLDLVVSTMRDSTSEQEEGMINREALVFRKAIFPSCQQIPDKGILEFVIDILQRKDKNGYFAKPIDGDEVKDYYNFIKEPMDFGTMREKLHEGLYTTLKKFQDDVYLICKNAMVFNSSSTIYYRKARSINELANRIFSTLKTNPENIVAVFLKKRQCGPKSKDETEGSSAKNDNKNKQKRVAHCRSSGAENRKSLAFNVAFNQAGWRHTYQPPSSRVETTFSSGKQLVLANDYGSRGLRYKESLGLFTIDLGPVAQKVVNQKLKLLNQTQSHSVRVGSQNESQEPAKYEDNVTTDLSAPVANHCADPTRRSQMVFESNSIDDHQVETKYLRWLNSDLPSFVGPISIVYPSTIVSESSFSQSGNLLQPNYNFLQTQQQLLNPLGPQNMYLQPPNQFEGLQQYNISQHQDLGLQLHMMNLKL